MNVDFMPQPDPPELAAWKRTLAAAREELRIAVARSGPFSREVGSEEHYWALRVADIERQIRRWVEINGTPGTMVVKMKQPQPKRERLVDALAAVSDATVRWWSAQLDEPPPRDRSLWRLRFFHTSVSAVADEGNGRRTYTPDVRVTVDGPQVAWEALHLAGLVPESALDDPRRRFATRLVAIIQGRVRATSDAWVRYTASIPRDQSWGTERAIPEADIADLVIDGDQVRWTGPAEPDRVGDGVLLPVHLPHPATVADAVALAADWRGVLGAEELARAYLAPLGEVPAALMWRFGPMSTASAAPLVSGGLPGSPGTWTWLAEVTRRAAPLVARAQWSAFSREWWRQRAPAGMLQPRWDALRDLTATGYAIADLSPDAITLLAPPLAATEDR